MKIGSNSAAAAEQQKAYFDMAPWEKMPDPMRENPILNKTFGGRPTTLDLRGFIKPFDRGGVVLASVLITQEDLPLQKAEKGMMKQWRVVGGVAAEDEERLTNAVAKQRDLIEAWAVAFIREFKSGDQLLDPRRPIRVGWALPPTTFKNPPWVGWPKEGEITEVARDAPVDESLPCGFMGNQCYSKKGAKGGFSFQQVTLPD